jgi:hypothetical protein
MPPLLFGQPESAQARSLLYHCIVRKSLLVPDTLLPFLALI